MKKSEIILIAFSVLSIAGKFLNVPLSGILSVLSLTTLGLLYFIWAIPVFFGMDFSELFNGGYKKLGARQIASTLITGWGLGVALNGVLFKLQIWPGADTILFVGSIATSFSVLVSLAFYRSSKEQPYLNMLKRSIPILLISLLAYSTTSRQLLEAKYPDNPEYIEAFIAAQENPDDEELQAKEQEEWDKMYEDEE